MLLNPSPIIFVNEPRGYWLGDKQMQGITGMLSRQLFQNKYADIPAHILKNAAERGSRIHSDIETFDMFGVAESEESRLYAEMKRKENFQVLRSEYLVTDGVHFASAIDKVMQMDDGICLGDVKTTAKLDEDYVSWQLSTYRYLFELQNPHIEVKRLYAIWVRNGASVMREVNMIPKDIIIELLECDINHIQFQNPYRQTVVTTESEEANKLIAGVTHIITQIKELQELKSSYDKRIEALFADTGANRWETDHFIIQKNKDSLRSGFDTARFKKEHPDLYNEYIKQTPVRGAIKSTLK